MKELGKANEGVADSDKEMDNIGGEAEIDSTIAAKTLLEIDNLYAELTAKMGAMFLSSNQYKNIDCFNPALHNVVGDGFKVADAQVGNFVGKVKY